ncbi:MAG: hypothetical protein OMM_06703 [Candidatus Magnetoglobus multicellularis str. Araruama]|uniref:Uncharacterized protein n=1 Tax=Candidatus Magnetoglobus multicellularis str. Araruama TaxID=890399 RepID=A0A1V1PG05_9BACT|nr:MAG: hypothetical protein OMM_06703 [Candidatus Magnetoglobus multicellularis str. Araruama]
MQMPNHSCIITDNESSDEDFMGQDYLPVIYERDDELDHAIIAIQPLMVQKWPVFYIYIQIVFVIILSCLCHGIIFQTIYGAVDQHNALENISQIITIKNQKHHIM